jgi:hypothetical protein
LAGSVGLVVGVGGTLAINHFLNKKKSEQAEGENDTTK